MLFSLEQTLSSVLNINPQVLVAVFLLVALWSTVWKGMALWKSARRGEKWWFIALLVINTIGILEILYIYVFSKKDSNIPTPQA